MTALRRKRPWALLGQPEHSRPMSRQEADRAIEVGGDFYRLAHVQAPTAVRSEAGAVWRRRLRVKPRLPDARPTR